MGAQAAALLAAGGPVGDVPPDGPWDGALRLDAPEGFALWRVARTHGGVGLAPTAWDGARLHLRLPGPVVVEEGPVVRWRGAPPDPAVLRRVLALDDDPAPLWDACDQVPAVRWVRAAGAGRVLRAPTVWQDLVGALAGTRTSYRGTQAMVRRLVGDGPFPTAAQVLAADLAGWGFRAPALRELAERVAGGWDPEELREGDDDSALERLRGLRGVGPFTAAQVMPLLGRPRPLVHDGWLAAQVPDPAPYAALGRWGGTAAWLSALPWLR